MSEKLILKDSNIFSNVLRPPLERNMGSEDGNIVFFGLCVMQDAELGYVTLSDLESINVERDLYWEGTLADAQKEHK